jgi:hypothetical protein
MFLCRLLRSQCGCGEIRKGDFFKGLLSPSI